MKKSKGRIVFEIINTVIMLFLIVVSFYPIYYVIVASLSRTSLIMQHTGILLKPLGLSFAAYENMFKTNKIVNGYVNTLTILVIGLVLNLVLTIIGAYFFSRKGMMLRRPLMVIVMITMFFNGGLIPFYMTVCSLGIYDSLWAVILPSAINTFNLIILRTSFESIPDSMEESAILDGAGELTIIFRIIVPLSKASLAVVLLYYAVGHWNAWFNAMIFLRTKQLYPLQLILREFLIENDTDAMTGGASGDYEGIAETVKYAVICVSTLPILCIYPFLQKYFVKGVMIGAVKG